MTNAASAPQPTLSPAIAAPAGVSLACIAAHATCHRTSYGLTWMLAGRLVASAFALLLLCLSMQPAARAQNVQHTGKLVDKTKRSEFRVDPSTLGLNIEINLAGYPGRAGVGLPIALNYSSKVWRMKYMGQGDASGGFTTLVAPNWGEHTAAGWTSTLGVPKFTDDPQELYDSMGFPTTDCSNHCRVVRKVTVQMPDGSSHVLRHTSPIALGTDSPSGTYYAMDGSGLRYEYDSKTLYLPDGSRYVLGSFSWPVTATTYTDRNGNTLSYDHSTNLWTDTLGRTIAPPPMPTDPGDYTYSIPGVGNTSITYTFKWRRLADARTDPSHQLAYYGDCDGMNFVPPIPPGPALFFSAGLDKVCAFAGVVFNPLVLAEIGLPNGTSYKFSYNIYGELDKVIYPTGGYERFRYESIHATDWVRGVYEQTNRGVVEHKVSANGSGTDEVAWHYSAGYATPNYDHPYKVTSTAPDGTRTERYLHAAGIDQYPWGFSDVRIGRAYDERVFSSTNQMLRRTLTHWATSPEGAYANGRNARVSRQVEILLDTGGDAPAKATEMSYDADLNVTGTRHYGYVTISQSAAQSVAIGVIPNGALLRENGATFLVNDPGIPQSTRDAYRTKNLLRLPSKSSVRDALGNVVAQSEVRYDETADPLISCPDIVQWTDPGTSARGNATTTRSGLKVGGMWTWLEGHAQYDQAGNVRKTWEPSSEGSPRGNMSETVYTSAYKYAYPEKTVSPIPDDDASDGLNGSTAALTTEAAYHFDTGLVTSTKDANGKVTSFSYADDSGVVDPLNRLKKVTRPDGGRTSYEYFDDPAAGVYVRMLTDLDASRWVESRQYFDGLGRPTRAYSYDGSAPDRAWVATKTTYDSLGRVRSVSNPLFRADHDDFPAGSSTTTDYDALARVITVTTPDGAQVRTDYMGNEMTVTDQAGKQRRSVSDALGRLVQVVEAPGAAGYGYETRYEYDALGNLQEVIQGKAGQVQQTRTFVYDSLSRLTSTTNPESGTVNYEYDATGNLKKRIDARHVQTDYEYDALNRIISRSHSVEQGHEAPAGYVATAAVSYFYDGTGMPEEGGQTLPTPENSKGRLTAVKTAASETYYTEFDAAGRVKKHRQVTDAGAAGMQKYLMEYGYDLAGNLTSQTYPSGRWLKIEYDSAGRLAGVRRDKLGNFYVGGAAGDAANRVAYTAHGAASAVRLGNGLWEHTTFNARLQATEIGLGSSPVDSSVLRLEYSYGLLINGALDPTRNNGNLQGQKITIPGLALQQSYEYDELNRLEVAREANGASEAWKQTFLYPDAYGNRRIDANKTTAWLVGDNPSISASNNRINSPGYVYDAAGNLTDKPGFAYGYDAESRMSVANNGQEFGLSTYAYDGDGRRVRKVTGAGAVTVFVYDAFGKLVAEYANAIPASNGTRYLTADHLGSPRVVTDSAGNVKARHDYLPFGEELFAGPGGRSSAHGFGVADGLRQKFTGYERDAETGLDFAQARYYSSQHGRFTSPDPLLASGNPVNPKTWNRYVYVLNNPLRFIDPEGLIAGDFYDRKGNKLGTDGIDDNKVYLLNEGKAVPEIPNPSLRLPLDNLRIEAMKTNDFTEVGGLIIMDRTEAGADCTTSEFKTVGGNPNVEGAMLEPGGPETTTPNQDKRIPEGVYNLDNHSGRKHKDTFVIYNSNVPKSRAILFHAGYTGKWTEGCIMPGAGVSGGAIKSGTSEPKMNELKAFIKSEGAANVKLIIRNAPPPPRIKL